MMSKISFEDGTELETIDQEKYVAGISHRKSNQMVEINNNIKEAMITLKKMEVFWKEAPCSQKLKINVYYAVIVSKLVYGLESLQMTDKQMEKFDTFLYRGLRKILKVPSTYIDRMYTNKWLIDKANEITKKV